LFHKVLSLGLPKRLVGAAKNKSISKKINKQKQTYLSIFMYSSSSRGIGTSNESVGPVFNSASIYE
jgi:hypothetical protein